MSNEELTIKTDTEKVSYGIGLQLGQQVKGQSFPGFSLDALIIGLSDIFNNKPMRFSENEMQAAFSAINQKIQEQSAKAAESGLQYEILKEGTGKKPSPADDARGFKMAPNYPIVSGL